MAKKLMVSPKGEAVYPHLNTPDTKFKKEGERHVKLRCQLDDPKAQALKTAIDKVAAETLKTAKAENAKALGVEKDKEKLKGLKKANLDICADLPYSVDEEDGTITFTFKQRASGEKKDTGEKWTRGLPFFSASGKPLDEKTTKIGGGSVLKISHQEPEGFYTAKLGAGATLRLEGVQVFELKEWSRSAESLGFEAEEEEAETLPTGTEDGDPGPNEQSGGDDTSADDF